MSLETLQKDLSYGNAQIHDRRDPVAEQMSEATEARAGVEAIEASLEDD